MSASNEDCVAALERAFPRVAGWGEWKRKSKKGNPAEGITRVFECWSVDRDAKGGAFPHRKRAVVVERGGELAISVNNGKPVKEAL